MIRTAAILVTLLAQVVSPFAQGAFVLCVHSDGQSRIEFAWATCGREGSGHCHCGAAYGPNLDQTTPSDDDQRHDECCGSCSGDGACRDAAVRHEGQGGRSFTATCDHCTDCPVVSPPLIVSAETRQRQADIDRGTPCLTDTVFHSTGLRPDHAFQCSFGCCGPPGCGVPAHLATTILRC